MSPNWLLLRLVLASAANRGWLNRFSTSRRSVARDDPPVRKSLLIARSVLLRIGDRTPGRMRGALPIVFAAASTNAAAFRYLLSTPPEFSRRDTMSPGTR